MRPLQILFIAVALVATLSFSSLAQTIVLTYNQIDAMGFPSIKSYVIVTDSSGAPITGITNSNFTVEEDGTTESPITFSPVGATVTATSVALAIDRSGSMEGQPIADAKSAATKFVEHLQTGNKAAVISFSNKVAVDLDFTADKFVVIAAINGISTSDNTAIYDALYESINRTSPLLGRKAIILLTDGANNSGTRTIDEAINYAKQQNIPVFTIGLGITPGSTAEQSLQRIVQETGGVYYRSPTSSDLAQIYQHISQQLQNQYSITYKTHNQAWSDSVRTVTITVNYSNKSDTKQRQYTMRINNVFFDFDKSDLKPESYPELDRLAKIMKENADAKVEIAGHTDSQGLDAYNLELSKRRAQTVVNYLISVGCSSTNLVAKGYGESKPVASNETEEGRAENRRVEFKFVK